MKKYILMNDNDHIILLGIKEIKKIDKFLIIEDGKPKYFTEIIFDNFCKEICSSRNGYIWSVIKPNKDGGYELYDKDENKVYRTNTKLRFIEHPKDDKFFLEFEDDDSAALWCEGMKGEMFYDED